LYESNEKYILVKKWYDDVAYYGVVDIRGFEVIPTRYDYISLQKHGNDYYFAIKDKYKNKIGLLNSYRNVVIPFEYDMIRVSNNNDDWIIVDKDDKRGVIDFNNNIIIPFEYFSVGSLSEKLAVVKYVAPDSIAKILSSNAIKDASFIGKIHNGLLIGDYDLTITSNPNYTYKGYSNLELLNALSDTLFRRNYYELNSEFLGTYFPNYEAFSLSLIVGHNWSTLPKKVGYFNDSGEQVIDFIYDDAKSFENGLAPVKFNNMWGVINKKGEVVIPIKYEATKLWKVEYYDLYGIKKRSEKGKRITVGFVDVNGVEYFENN